MKAIIISSINSFIVLCYLKERFHRKIYLIGVDSLMKKTLILLVTLLFVVILCGCDNENLEENTTKMYINVAELTKEEKDIIDLLGVNKKTQIFDFTLDKTVKSMHINTYKLVDGKWKRIYNDHSRAFTDLKGRLAIEFEEGFEDMKIAVQSEHSNGSSSNTTNNKIDIYDGMGVTTSLLSNQTEIIYEKEIPLAIQIITSKNEVSSYIVKYFEKPEEYEKLDYEYVYAVTVMFSQKELGYENIDIPKEDKIDEIIIEGMTEEVNYKGIKSSLGYTIQYDDESLNFTRENEKDIYRANSDEIKDKVHFTVEYLNKSYDELKIENKENNIEELVINGQKAFKATFIDDVLFDENNNTTWKWDSDVKTLWYIAANNGTYLIEEHYFFEAAEGWGVRLNQMLNTLKIYK